MNQILIGAIALGSLLVGLFFFRFWRRSGDRFFLFFALSFWIEAGNRLTLGLLANSNELDPMIYSLRVIAYGLILVAIIQKNRPKR
ncbi:DUF5985 family protein [Ramlibacter rhizophilus]|uniref:Uncharacterized protein n=1 Tax=Ramlibacter rhizophilus TaxID=1781167 RepID=A0A4Z0BHC3_9BURK|nr:DUF5985 family protein [Ramlibacter rhizophilus]TFY97524.1 hypothetical protein EZ242_18580 [Ramlibacter rhizophilus]